MEISGIESANVARLLEIPPQDMHCLVSTLAQEKVRINKPKSGFAYSAYSIIISSLVLDEE